MSATCKSCGADIIWAEVKATGKKMPVDPEPVPNGTVLLSRSQTTGAVYAVVLKASDIPPSDAILRTSHFTTCPDAARHRKARP